MLATALVGIVAGTAPTALAAVTLSAGYQYVGNLRALALRDRGPGWPDALLAVGAIAIADALLLRTGSATASWPPALAYSTLGYFAGIVAYDLSRHAWPRQWLRRARPLDHGLKMTGMYFAMASAGAGNLLPAWQPWSQGLPSAIGTLVMVVFAGSYLRRATLEKAA